MPGWTRAAWTRCRARSRCGRPVRRRAAGRLRGSRGRRWPGGCVGRRSLRAGSGRTVRLRGCGLRVRRRGRRWRTGRRSRWSSRTRLMVWVSGSRRARSAPIRCSAAPRPPRAFLRCTAPALTCSASWLISSAVGSLTRLCPHSRTTLADIDIYYASHLAHQRQAVRAFLIWALEHGHIPGHLNIPRQPPSAGQAITQQRRIGLLRRFATDTTIAIRPRAAACLLLLYAQPLSRILQLTADDLTRDEDGQTWLRLGEPPSPVPEPFDTLLRQLAASRHDHTPANHASTWLFPGRRAASPPPTGPCPPSSATSACPCAPPASPPCASSSCRSPPRSSPTPSDSATPPPHASTPMQAHPGADTSAAMF